MIYGLLGYLINR